MEHFGNVLGSNGNVAIFATCLIRNVKCCIQHCFNHEWFAAQKAEYSLYIFGAWAQDSSETWSQLWECTLLMIQLLSDQPACIHTSNKQLQSVSKGISREVMRFGIEYHSWFRKAETVTSALVQTYCIHLASYLYIIHTLVKGPDLFQSAVIINDVELSLWSWTAF